MAKQTKTLVRVLSQAGVASRSEAAGWIRAGRVQVNGRVVVRPEAWIEPSTDLVLVDGEPLHLREPVYLLLHKPVGVLTSRAPELGARKTVYDLLPPGEALVHPVGRLDLDSSGLLLVTNDTQLAEALSHPSFGIAKTYEVKATGRLSEDQLEALRRGPRLKDGPTRPASVKRLREPGGKTVFEISITEGRNRQVRRMVLAVGGKVLRLKRVGLGPLSLEGIAPGECRALTREELRSLRAVTGRGAGRIAEGPEGLSP